MKEEPDAVLSEIKNKILSEVLQDITVGHIKNTEWFKECKITKKVKGDLLNPERWIRFLDLKDSPFGYKNKTVVDGNIRLCKEISLQNCDLRLRNLAQQVVGSNYHCEPYKLVVYDQGGFFRQHTDTPNDNLVKTLVLHLPTQCVGGDLVFNNWNPQQYYTKGDINFVLFKIKHPHRVTEVTQGVRVSLLFKVFDYKSLDIINKFQGEVCAAETTISLPETYKNVLVVYPDLKFLKNTLEQFKLDYMQVYFNNIEDRIVYDSYMDEEPADFETTMDFKDLVNGATSYKVEHLIDLGEPSEATASYIYSYGYTGNEAFETEETVNFHTGYLINPVDNDQPSPKKIKLEDQ